MAGMLERLPRVRDFVNRAIDNLPFGRSRSNAVFVSSRVGGVWLTHDEAIRLSVVWACTSIISKALASSKWDVRLEKPNGDMESARNTRAYSLLNVRPNPEMGPFSFTEATIAKAVLYGDSYAEIERDGLGRAVALWPVEPYRVIGLERNEFGELQLRVRNYAREDSVLPYNDVYHIHGLGLDGRTGLDLVGIAARSFLQALAAERFALKFYEHGTAMGGVLSTERDIDKAKLKDIKDNVQARVSGIDNAFQFLILGGGLKFQSLSQDFDKAQFSETRNWLIEEGCRWFGVPPHKVAHLEHATFSNIEHEGISFQRDGLRPWAVRAQQEADYKICVTAAYSTRINLDWAAEGDAKSRAETDAILVSNGLERRNESRRRRGQNSLGAAGEALTVQANMTTLERLIAGPVQVAVPPEPDDDEPPIPKPLKQVAALALFANAFKRGLRRQTSRAVQASLRSKGALKSFERVLDGQDGTHIAYMKNELLEVLGVLRDAAVNTGDTPVSTMAFDVATMCAEERGMLTAAFQRGNLRSWCNIDARAESLAQKIVSTGGA